MAAEQQEQNRSEAPTPFKLRRARERGMVARSTEVGFVGGLIALAIFLAAAGDRFAHRLAELTRRMLVTGISQAADPGQGPALVGGFYWNIVEPLMLLGATILVVVIALELIQLRGFVFTAQPLKPDFTRLNPATGLKRLFSMRLLKETLKSVLKAAAYGIAMWLVLTYSIDRFALVAGEGDQLAGAMKLAAMRLIFVFLGIAVGFALLDQMLVRGEFLKQMRMSRREVTRENKDREGDPRIRQKRKELHREYVSQSQGAGNLSGADLLLVNPEHFAVALRYDAATMRAPNVLAKGRNRLALAMRAQAARLGVPVIRNPALARALYRACTTGREIPPGHYEPIADLYIQLRRDAAEAAKSGPAP